MAICRRKELIMKKDKFGTLQIALKNIRNKPFRSFGLIFLTMIMSYILLVGSFVLYSFSNGTKSLSDRLGADIIIVPEGYKSLYDFWGDTLNAYLASKLMHDERVIINVASQEYGKVVRKNKLPQGTRIIDIRFLQHETNGFRQVVVHVKKARGLMARFIIKNRLTKHQDVQAFDSEGYFFYPDLSKEDEWVFVR